MSNARQNVSFLTSVSWDIPALRLAVFNSGSVPAQVVLKNNWSSGDGGGLFLYDAADTTSADNGGTLIVDASGNRWKRQESKFVDPRWFGARVDARVLNDGVCAGTTTITSATANFTSADVGKAIFFGFQLSRVVTTIISVSNANTAIIGTTGPTGSGFRFIVGTDDTAAWQACFDFGENTARDIVAPNGWSVISSTLVYDTTSQTSDPFNGRRSGLVLTGASAASNGWYAFHDGTLLDVRYGSADGTSTWLRIQGMAFHGPLRRVGSIGLKIDNCAYFEIENCDIAFFDRGVLATDTLSGVFGENTVRLNNQGVEFNPGVVPFVSRPNSITFRDCIFATNYYWAGLVVGAACVRILGGSIEGNGIGLPLASTSAWGFKVIDAGFEGGIGLEVGAGCYIEGNNGNADIWIDQQNNEALHNISGSFVRYLAGQYVTQNILFTRDPARTSSFVRVSGSMFKALNTYVEDVSRPYIFAPHGTIFDGGANEFQNPIARPLEVFAPGFIPRFLIASPPPNPTLWPGRMIILADAPGAQQLLTSDGTRWQRIETNWTAVNADAEITCTPLSRAREVTLFGALTTDRIVILATTNVLGQTNDIGETFVISRTATGAFNTEVRNATAGGTLLATLTTNQWAEFKYDGSTWLRFASGSV